MCGIAGIISNKRNLEASLHSMSSTLKHRGPDNQSFKVFDNLGMAHTRLSIIDLSNDANQPMTDNNERFTIIFNGEIYNYKELKNDLIKEGCFFNTSSDTEVILNGYSIHGSQFFRKVRGFFALAIYDSRKRTLTLSRDVYGKKPIYYSFAGSEFLFASELKAIRSEIDATIKINYDAISHYLWKGYFVDGDTIDSSIQVLHPGVSMEVNLDSLEHHTHSFDQIEINLSHGKSRDIKQIESELEKSINYRMIADVPISFMLSGGIDSSLVSYFGSKDTHIDTYYIGYGEKEDQFRDLSIYVSERIRSNHHIHDLMLPDFAKILDMMIDIFDEPFADYSAIPSFEIYKIISKKTKVAISGDGADEIFCGYKDSRLFLLREYLNFTFKDKGQINYLDSIYGLLNSRNKSMRYLGYMISYLMLNEGHFSATTFRGGWNHNTRKISMTTEGYQLTGKDNIEKKEILNFINSGNSPMERYLNYELKKLTYDFLVKVDRTSMANSLEVRSPFLDRKMLEMLPNPSIRSMVGIFETKKELKKILRSNGLDKITRVKKEGFTPPLGKWMTSDSGFGALQKLQKNDVIRRLFKDESLSNMTRDRASVINNQARLWNLMVLSRWYDRNFE